MANNNLVKALGATAQAMGQNPTPEALVLMAEDLDGYSEQDIANALRSLRRKGGRFCIASILDYITALDGRPSPDAAWAMFPKTEDESAVITQEMSEAWAVASEQYFSGDGIGAQIAFKREYAKIIEKSRDTGEPVSWFASLGHDPGGRSDALIDAVERGRLTVDHASGLLGHDPNAIKLLAQRALSAGVLTHDQAQAYLPGPDDKEQAAKNLSVIRNGLKVIGNA